MGDLLARRFLLTEHHEVSSFLAPRAHDFHDISSTDHGSGSGHFLLSAVSPKHPAGIPRPISVPGLRGPRGGGIHGPRRAKRAVTLLARRRRRSNMGKLDGKVVVVTGASRGIGAEIARLFAAEGGRVICAARTLREGEHQLAGSLETTVAGIRDAGGEARAITANIAEPAECERLIAAARDV